MLRGSAGFKGKGENKGIWHWMRRAGGWEPERLKEP